MRFVAIILLAASAGTASGEMVSGPVRVIDGDTFDVGTVRVRLHGIDAVETEQDCVTDQGARWTCGHYVTDEVRARYQGRTARCDVVTTDRYGRAVAACRVDGQDIGAALVRDGLAFAYRRYSTAYVAEENAAQADDRGLWASSTQQPEAFRRQGARQTADRSCAIKGNISANGRIFHQPGDAFYSRTRINPAKGERWFCSVRDALSAGWRPASR